MRQILVGDMVFTRKFGLTYIRSTPPCIYTDAPEPVPFVGLRDRPISDAYSGVWPLGVRDVEPRSRLDLAQTRQDHWERPMGLGKTFPTTVRTGALVTLRRGIKAWSDNSHGSMKMVQPGELMIFLGCPDPLTYCCLHMGDLVPRNFTRDVLQLLANA